MYLFLVSVNTKLSCPSSVLLLILRPPRLRAEQFVPGNQEHVKILKSMGITVVQTKDGRIQLMQSAASVRLTAQTVYH